MPNDIFSLENTQRFVTASLDDATALVPDGKKSALIIDATKTAEGGKVRLVYAYRKQGGWHFNLATSYDGHHVEGKASLIKTWP